MSANAFKRDPYFILPYFGKVLVSFTGSSKCSYNFEWKQTYPFIGKTKFENYCEKYKAEFSVANQGVGTT